MYTGLKNPSWGCLQPFLKSLSYIASLGSHLFTQQTEQGLPQGSFPCLLNTLEAPFCGLRSFNLLHPSNLGWWIHGLTGCMPRVLLAGLITWNEKASKVKAILLACEAQETLVKNLKFVKWKGKLESLLQCPLKTSWFSWQTLKERKTHNSKFNVIGPLGKEIWKQARKILIRNKIFAAGSPF